MNTNNKISILGAGESGTGAAILAKKHGFDVLVSDNGKIKDKYKTLLSEHNIKFEENGHSFNEILESQTIIKSPGIPDKVEIIKKIKEKNIPIISEIEFAARYTKAVKICITGSNGKTTTTKLIYHLLKTAGLNVAICGNVGESFAAAVAKGEYDYFVIELSSFQLDNMYEFKAEVAVLLNITPDHLDRYDYKFENYIDSKFRIIQNQTENDIFIYDADDPIIKEKLDKIKTPVIKCPFSTENNFEVPGYLQNNYLKFNLNNNFFEMNTNEMEIEGVHNHKNALAAGISASYLRINNSYIREGFSNFRNVEHRLEKYIKVKGVQYINDSKATNVNSVWFALQTMRTKVILIAGGIDKGNDYSILTDLVKEKVKTIIILGNHKENLESAFCSITEIKHAKDMEEAVRTAYEIAQEGETVLLSPACASFDLFDNYEHRGLEFKKAVREL